MCLSGLMPMVAAPSSTVDIYKMQVLKHLNNCSANRVPTSWVISISLFSIIVQDRFLNSIFFSVSSCLVYTTLCSKPACCCLLSLDLVLMPGIKAGTRSPGYDPVLSKINPSINKSINQSINYSKVSVFRDKISSNSVVPLTRMTLTFIVIRL